MDSFDRLTPYHSVLAQWHDNHASPAIVPEPIQLLQKLHASLDPRTVFACYGVQLQQFLPLYGMTLKSQALDLRWGRVKGIKLSHELTLGDEDAVLEYCLPMPLSPGELHQLQQLEPLLSQPLLNANSYQQMSAQAMFDALTGLGNRHFFGQSFRTALARAQRNHTHVSLILLDLDNFKQLNDKLGHNYGDQALVRFAEIVRRSIRRCDQSFRLGGDEFVILVEGDTSSAVSICQRILQQMPLDPMFTQHQVGCSAGVGEWQAQLNQDSLFAMTDAALYRAKAQGRNGYCIAE